MSEFKPGGWVTDAERVKHARAVQGAAIDRAAGTDRGPLTAKECGDTPVSLGRDGLPRVGGDGPIAL